MSCRFCGGEDLWIKRVWDGEGETFPACDLCYLARRATLIIVPAPWSITAKCTSCGVFGNPRDFSDLRPAFWREAYGGVCSACQ